MRKKSFSLGFGLGIICVSLIFWIVYGYQVKKLKIEYESLKTVLTDEEIIEKAEQLGMIFYSDLPQNSQNESKNTEEHTEMTQTDEPTTELNTDINSEDADIIEITINRGSSAGFVAEVLFEKGVIDDAEEFKEYLVDRNKSTKIKSGTFTFEKNMKYSEALKTLLNEK